MSRRSGLDIKKAILRKLKRGGGCSLRELESLVDTNYNSVIKHCEELAYFGLIKIAEHEKSKSNGRPYKMVSITNDGLKYAD